MIDADKPELWPANVCPWYWLATVHGEQDKIGTLLGVKPALAADNRRAWNRWMASTLSEQRRAALVKERGFSPEELRPLSDDERSAFEKVFAKRVEAALLDLSEEWRNKRKEMLEIYPEHSAPPVPQLGIGSHFSNLRFERFIFFTGYLFPFGTTFHQSEFSEPAHFEGAVFYMKADFGQAKFFGEARFFWAQFDGDTDFRATFSGNADFREAKFCGKAFFGTVPSHLAALLRPTFHDDTDLHATFSGWASFYQAQFSKAAFFGKVPFSNEAEFGKATFSNMAYFRKAAFSSQADFRATFTGEADFSDASFSNYANFMGCEFNSRTAFADAKFILHVPDFRDAKLREATEWHEAEWPRSLPKDQEAAQQRVYGYERLKAEMERLKKHEDEQVFFAKELRARRDLLWFKWRDKERRFHGRVKFALGGLLNWAYGFLSGYGLSIGKPLGWLFALFILGVPIFTDSSSLVSMDPWSAAALSASNLFPFLPYKADKVVIDCLSPAAKIVGDVQSVFGVVLLFLLGLALRNRFRMK